MEALFRPWPWYVSGPLIALVMVLLLMMGKNFGMSSNLRTLCAICGAGNAADFFKFDWRAQRWNLIVVLGMVIGGFLATNFLSEDAAVNIGPKTVETLKELGFQGAGTEYLPAEIYSTENLSDPKTLSILVIGGSLVGFGTRYAGGCTSGHAISGLSDLQWPSLVAVIGFFVGGLLMIHLLFPLIF